ncbi:hypothetical protein ACFXG6_04360 [Streptomyces roseus]|uniref:hypothetical protein n=1 Tax=Streptomyces roseus TaxID=66430 RepID=UPI0036876F5E
MPDAHRAHPVEGPGAAAAVPRGAPATADRFADAAREEHAAARPVRTTAYGLPLVRDVPVATLTDLRGEA